ncbi:MAG: XTP/dITP diphosphatase [Firmicutes bacterium]|nr:XTP/dITP diphosphatase [Bacillota bacterium]
MKIVFATKNENKLKEIREILGSDYEVVSMTEAGVDIDIEEDGDTFEANAIKKAEEVMARCNEVVLADDSGLEIDFLDGMPGVRSSRFMGEDTPYEEKNRAILEKMKHARGSQRSARFVCAIAAAVPKKYTIISKETIEGLIAQEPAGENGFGYDPIFYLPKYKKTTAELTMEEKNKISHRGKALRAIAERLKKIKW